MFRQVLTVVSRRVSMPHDVEEEVSGEDGNGAGESLAPRKVGGREAEEDGEPEMRIVEFVHDPVHEAASPGNLLRLRRSEEPARDARVLLVGHGEPGSAEKVPLLPSLHVSDDDLPQVPEHSIH